jgi:hypothetical protein
MVGPEFRTDVGPHSVAVRKASGMECSCRWKLISKLVSIIFSSLLKNSAHHLFPKKYPALHSDQPTD